MLARMDQNIAIFGYSTLVVGKGHSLQQLSSSGGKHFEIDHGVLFLLEDFDHEGTFLLVADGDIGPQMQLLVMEGDESEFIAEGELILILKVEDELVAVHNDIASVDDVGLLQVSELSVAVGIRIDLDGRVGLVDEGVSLVLLGR